MGKKKRIRLRNTWKNLLVRHVFPSVLLASALAAAGILFFRPDPLLNVFGQGLVNPLVADRSSNYAADALNLGALFDGGGLIEAALSAALGPSEPRLSPGKASVMGAATAPETTFTATGPSARTTRTPTPLRSQTPQKTLPRLTSTRTLYPTQPRVPTQRPATATRVVTQPGNPPQPTQPGYPPPPTKASTQPGYPPPATQPPAPTPAPTQPPAATQPPYPAPVEPTAVPYP